MDVGQTGTTKPIMPDGGKTGKGRQAWRKKKKKWEGRKKQGAGEE